MNLRFFLFFLAITHFARGEESPREVFWGTPSFSYAANVMPPPALQEFGVSYMSHLLYWFHWETAPGVWNDAYLNQRVALIDALHREGIVSGIRLGEAHPGARVWKMQEGKPYLGRNAKCYPGEEDTDERYFVYLAKLAKALRGKVDHYVLGDELDMIFGASFRDEKKLFEYLQFFAKAAKVIKKEDPGVKLVVFPFAWKELPKNIALLNKWGLALHANGVSLNISGNDCVTPAYLKGIASEIKDLSPNYGLYSNGFGYISDLLTEEGQAWRLAHTMLTIWEAGWIYLPYYLLASNTTPWSDGLYRENLTEGNVVRRQAADVFQRLAQTLRRKPKLDPTGLLVTGYVTPFGTVQPEEFPDAGVRSLWQSDGSASFGVLTTNNMNDPRVIRTVIALPLGPDGAALQVENVVTGEINRPDIQADSDSGKATAVIDVSNEPKILRWVSNP